MQDIIHIQQQSIGNDLVQTVNARDLHAFLGNGDQFSHWIKDRIGQHGFVENQDLVSFTKNSVKPQGGRPSKEYHLTIDAAKHIAIAELTPKGREARGYFETLPQTELVQKEHPHMEQDISVAQALSLSPQTLDERSVQTVNARTLHAFLGVGKVFAAWIQDRIQRYEFMENQDFIILSEIGKNYNGPGQPKKEYYLTLDMAKELAMIEHTDKGREARQYFIECERRVFAGETMVTKKEKPARKKPVSLADRASPLDSYLPIPYFRVIAGYLATLKGQKRIGKENTQAKIDAAQIAGQVFGVDIQRYLLLDSLAGVQPPAGANPLQGANPAPRVVLPFHPYLTATQIAEQLNLRFSTRTPNGHAANDLICAAGLAYRLADHRILPTPEGEKVCCRRPVLDAQGQPTSHETLTWDARIVERLRSFAPSQQMPLMV